MTLLSINLGLTSHLSGIYLESWFSWLWGAENIEEKKKTDRRKTWKSEEKEIEKNEESQITTIYIFGFKLYFARKHNLKKRCLYHQILFTVFIAGYLKRSNDIPNLNIHIYTNNYITEICINRLSTTMQIFIAIDHLIMISEKYLHFRKKNSWHGHFLPTT